MQHCSILQSKMFTVTYFPEIVHKDNDQIFQTVVSHTCHIATTLHVSGMQQAVC